MAYEIKRTRAAWDPTLAVPGTDRQGGWRCPPGTRYGGQITDRFGRNCGWGASRRLANSISDIGERLENVGDRRSGRRAARAERAAARVRKPGLVERAAGNIARALETDGTPAVEAPRAPRRNRGAVSRAPRLLPEERRRMQREIDQPGAARTGDVVNEPAPRRPRPAAPVARRRPAAQQVARQRPVPAAVPENVVPEAPAPVKKAAVKKVVAKKAPAKKVVKKKAVAKKAVARRVTTPANENAPEPRMSTSRPATPARPRVDSDNAANSERLRQERWEREQDNEERPATPRAATPPRVETPAAPPVDGLRDIFVGRDLGYNRDYIAQRELIERLNNFDNLSEERVNSQLADIRQALIWNREYLANVSALDPDTRIQMANRVARAGDLKRQIEGVVNAWEERLASADRRLIELNELRLPGMNGVRAYRNQSVDGHTNISDARIELSRLVGNNPGVRFNVVENNNRLYVISQEQLNEVKLRGNNPSVREFRGGLPLSNELPAIDSEVARQAEERVNRAIKTRQNILADYLNTRYGEGSAPWKDMTPARYQELTREARLGDADARRELQEWAKQMYSHPEINGPNGKKYRTLAGTRWNGDGLSVSVDIERQDPDGSWTNIGSSARTIRTGNPPSIYNNNMFIRSARDKNSGIQTIYNQHAFMYAKAAGFSHIDVTAVDDGRFVWGKIGFKQRLDSNKIEKMNDEVSKFRAGQDSLIDSESDARIIEHLIGKYVRDPNSVRHIDFVTAISNSKVGAAKKTRNTAIKNWFTENMVFSGGSFSLEENKIVADPRD